MKTKIIFLSTGNNFPSQLTKGEQETFDINPDIPIPVEMPADDSISHEQSFNFSDLSIDMIISGMLRVIEEREVEQEWIDYYCAFVFFLRPDILEKIKELGETGLNDENYLNAYKLVRDGKAEEGLNLIYNFLESYPLSWNGWFVLGWALRLLGRWQDACSALKKAIELDGDYSNTRNELAICLMEMKDFDGAKKELEAALINDSENVTIISNLGVLALKIGNANEADAYFKQVLEIDENDPVAKKYIRSTNNTNKHE